MSPNIPTLAALSREVSGLTAAAGACAAALGHRDGCSAILWQPDLLVTSEQAIGKGEVLRAVLPGGAVAEARLAGRDPGTNVAVLRLAAAAAASLPAVAEPVLGGLVLAIGHDGTAGASVRLGVVSQLGPAWQSQAGGRIDRRIVLDLGLGRDEGGPVIDAAGGLLGMSTIGPRGRAIVIPAATIARVVPTLLAHGRVARGWLGVGLQPVAVPSELLPQELRGAEGAGEQTQTTGLMVMGLSAGSPAAVAGVMQGDVLLAVDGERLRRPRALAERFGPDSIGAEVSLQLLRANQTITLRATIAARPSQSP